MFKPHALAAAALLSACIASSQATVVSLAADGQWNAFNVSDLDSNTFGVEWIDNANTLSPDFGTPLRFVFSIAPGFTGRLSVVDAGFAGDTYKLSNFGALLGATSAVPVQTIDSAPDIGTDFNAALADLRFSRASFDFGAGSYQIGGRLDQSVMLGGVPLNSSVGGLNLVIAAVPEPSSVALLIAALALLAFTSRQRRP